MLFALDERVCLDEFQDEAVAMAKQEYEKKKDTPDGMIHQYILKRIALSESSVIEEYLAPMYLYILALKSSDKMLIAYAKDEVDDIIRFFETENDFQGKQAVRYFHKILGF